MAFLQRSVVQHGLGCSGQQALRTTLRPKTQQQPQHQCRRQSCVVRAGADGSSEDEVARLLAETNKLVNEMDQKAKGSSSSVPSTSEIPEGMELYCDVNGCTIMPVNAAGSVAYGPSGSMMASVDEGGEYGDAGLMDFQMSEGEGWKLGVDRAEVIPDKYCAAIGSNSFTSALTLAEYEDFVKLLRDLQRSVQTMQTTGEWKSNESEEATLEMSTERVWLQGRAPSQTLQALQAAWSKGGTAPSSAFSLRFIFTGMGSGREVSGVWSAIAVAEALASLDTSATAATATAATVSASN